MTYKQVVLVGGIVHHDGKILLLKRLNTKKFFSSNWEMPGGKLDSGESLVEAVIRETKEETGLDAGVSKVYNTWIDMIENNGTTEHIVEIDFILDVKNVSRVILSEKEHSEFKWVTKNELPSLMTQQMRSTLELAFKQITK